MYRGITEQGLVALHEVVRQRFPHGITEGKIDEGKIKAIAEKPYMQPYGHVKYDTIYRKAACYLEGITRLHPFPDGNKRTAILVAFVTCRLSEVVLGIKWAHQGLVLPVMHWMNVWRIVLVCGVRRRGV